MLKRWLGGSDTAGGPDTASGPDMASGPGMARGPPPAKAARMASATVHATPRPAPPPYELHGDESCAAQPPARVWAEAVAVEVGPTWAVRLADLPPDAARVILEDLTCEPNAEKREQHPFRTPITFCLGAVRAGGWLHVPPWYGKAAFPAARVVRNTLTRGADAAFGEFRGALREHPPQRAAAARYLSWLADHQTTPSCIVSLPCGYGKTVLCLWLLAALGRRACVIAHTNALVDQWQQEVRRFLPGARLGHVKEGGDVLVDDVDIVIASLQSLRPALARGDAWVTRLTAATGSVVLDEGHHAVAATFWEVLSAIPAAYRLVLTATPRRGDGLGPQLAWVSGPVIFRAIRTVDEVHVANVCFTGEGHGAVMRRGQLQLADMVNTLCEDPARTALAVAVVAHLVTTQRRRVIVITPRVTHIHVVADAVEVALNAAGVPRRSFREWIPHDWVPRIWKPKAAKKVSRKAPKKAGDAAGVGSAAPAAPAALAALVAPVAPTVFDWIETAWDVWIAFEHAAGHLMDGAVEAASAAAAKDRAVAASTPADGAGTVGMTVAQWMCGPWYRHRAAWVAMSGPGHWEDAVAPLVGRVLAGSSSRERRAAFEAVVFVASDMLLREGVSVVEMDTLVSLANLKDVEQAVGRILRECPTKRVPLMVDFFMAEGVFAGLHKARCKHYADQGFKQWRLTAAGPHDLQPEWWARFDKGGVEAAAAVLPPAEPPAPSALVPAE